MIGLVVSCSFPLKESMSEMQCLKLESSLLLRFSDTDPFACFPLTVLYVVKLSYTLTKKKSLLKGDVQKHRPVGSCME